MKKLALCLLVALSLSACNIEEAIKRNDDRYLKPGALDLPLTGVNDTYQFKFLDKYRVTHEWPRISNCSYRKIPTLNVKDGHRGEFWAARDIYEESGKTWQRFEGMTPFDFDQYVRSVKVMRPVYGESTTEELEASYKAMRERVERSQKTGRYEKYVDPGIIKPIGYKEVEEGLRPVCFESWYVTSHFMRMGLQKRSLQDWQDLIDKPLPSGKWSVQPVAGNNWAVRELQDNELSTRPLNGVGGPYQFWLLPIGDTGYTLSLQLGASKESLQYPEAHARMKAAFRHLIESVKIELLTAQLEAEHAELTRKARKALREDCAAMVKRSGPFKVCKDLLAQPAD